MTKTILVTGSTDGIGLATATRLASEGHHLLLHGRDPAKLSHAKETVGAVATANRVEGFVADLSRLAEADALAATVAESHPQLDVVINNAGVFRTPTTVTVDGLDARFAVNAIAPYQLTRRLLRSLGAEARVINIASAAQSPVDLRALAGAVQLSDFEAYAQSKLALTMWSFDLARERSDDGPVVAAVNPGSMLGTKMVREGFGVAGGDVATGVDILTRAALTDEFAEASGTYYDNDSHRFASPHPDALDPRKTHEVVAQIDAVLSSVLGTAG